jgi:hypothetical protein
LFVWLVENNNKEKKGKMKMHLTFFSDQNIEGSLFVTLGFETSPKALNNQTLELHAYAVF